MGSMSIWHWVIVLVFVCGPVVTLLTIIPMWRIISRLGFPGVLSLLSVVPFVNIICLWLLAFAVWPKADAQTVPSASWEIL